MPDAQRWVLEPISREHERDRFDCGNGDLNAFLSRYARQSEDLGLARTFVAVSPKELIVQGYYSMRSGQVEVVTLPPGDTKRFPRYPVPVVHLARLAVDRNARGQGLGEFLLLDALDRALAASRKIAAFAVEVVAVDAAARGFYLKYGFKELVDDQLHMYLPMRTVERLFRR
ncbi:MAG: GNAT family N-acetyltransferase [Elusimicrobia bacterium]|nr:GNAT family N-acetyltransferase [Elusimicrobiota bacterium]